MGKIIYKMSKEIEMIMDNVLVSVPLPKTETESGIIISEQLAHETTEDIIGDVISIGPLVKHFSVGDKILLPPHGSIPISYKKDIYHVFKEFMLFAKVNT
jgi:co-chaperonin GroES (HSP10)